ncbi:hypothetical protein BDC45DRAFT_530520 [Circinella umbellata]|nr:hypothetical protein BDC45DRAFT_530520 [Circinella umbellata]
MSSSTPFEPYKKQSRMTAFFSKQNNEQHQHEQREPLAATRTKVREEYQQVIQRIESIAKDEEDEGPDSNDLWDLMEEQRIQSKVIQNTSHGDLSKLVSRSGGPTIQPRITKKKNINSAIAKMKAKHLPKEEEHVKPKSSEPSRNIKVATLRSNTSLSAKDFEQRLKERIIAKRCVLGI